jgi:hypothetical protein
MCVAFSCILKRNGDTLTNNNPHIHSHEAIIKLHGLQESKLGPDHTGWVRIECTPPRKNDLNYASSVDDWIITVDESTVPQWYSDDRDSYETKVRAAARKWQSGIMIDGQEGCYKLESWDNDTLISEWWCSDDKCHRDGGPAVIDYNDDGSVAREEWFCNGKCHRDGGPAVIDYNDDGSVAREEWFCNGKWHRDGGPAVIGYNGDGSVAREWWYSDGKFINITPATIC